MFSCKLFVTINAASWDMKCWNVWHILYLETMFLLKSHISVGIRSRQGWRFRNICISVKYHESSSSIWDLLQTEIIFVIFLEINKISYDVNIILPFKVKIRLDKVAWLKTEIQEIGRVVKFCQHIFNNF
jgi:hypothetical protein